MDTAVIPAPVDPIEQLIDVDEVAMRMDVSADTVWAMSRDGRFIRPIDVGRLKRWRVRDFNRWVEQRAAARETIDATARKAAGKRNGRRRGG